jgi:cytochrome c oxidase assembly protein subunit 11
MEKMAKKNLKALSLAMLALGASGALAVYAVPLYEMFCKVTGYGGTVQRADANESGQVDRVITVRFDGSVDRGLPWKFRPVQVTQDVKVGETMLAFYEATNLSDHAITGSAVFNVTPHKAGLYFSKIECFCFTEQTLEPGETASMPVTYYIEPDIVDDRKMDHVQEITLSYSFFSRDDGDTTGGEV